MVVLSPLRAWPLLLVSSLACSPTPPAPAASPATAVPSATAPPTFRVSFGYEPSLTLRLLRDGQPYSGDAVLSSTSHEEPASLTFHQGQAPLSREVIERFVSRDFWELRVADHSVVIPRGGSANPMQCAQSVEALGALDPCTQRLPEPALWPRHCEPSGQEAWRQQLAQLGQRKDACWTRLDESTLQRLHAMDEGSPELGGVCQRLIGLLRKSAPLSGPSFEQRFQLMPHCLSSFESHERQPLHEAYERTLLPAALAAARQGSSAQMRLFYHRFREVAPEAAEEIRALAARRFGPADPARWLSLRHAIEAYRAGPWRASLCDITTDHVELLLQESEEPPRQGQRLSSHERSLPAIRIRRDPAWMRRVAQRDQMERRIESMTKARVGLPAYFVSRCSHEGHWYLVPVAR